MANFVAAIFLLAFISPFTSGSLVDYHSDHPIYFPQNDHLIDVEHASIDISSEEYTVQPIIESTPSIPRISSPSPDGDQMVELLVDGLDYMLSNETESTPTNGAIDPIDMFASDLHDLLNDPAEALKLNEEKKDCKDDKNQCNPHCEIVQGYDVIKRHWLSSTSYSGKVVFAMKNMLHLMGTLDKTIEYYAVRSYKIGQTDSNEDDGVHYTLVPWKKNIEEITIDNLQPGQYVFQICALTDKFQPTFLGDDHFDWPKHAQAYHLHLYPDSKEEMEK